MKKIRERTFSGSQSQEMSAREIQNRETARLAAIEGIVLLKNENGLLPIAKGQKLGLFGGGAGHTIKGGTGSGDVCERASVTVWEGLEKAGFRITSTDWLSNYDEIYAAAREDWKNRILKEAGGAQSPTFFDVYVQNAFQMPAGREIVKTDLDGADTAVYVLSRVSGEGADRHDTVGDYYLSEAEKDDLKKLSEFCSNIVLLINAPGQIDMKDILSIPEIRAIVDISQPGMAGGEAVAAVLGGVSPSGKLTDTWTYRYEDFPNAETFSYHDGDLTKEKYTDGIYVGYRYFDSFEKEVLYPFGFGLSYTSFELTVAGISVHENEMRAAVRVKNTGAEYSGREVIQLYIACPNGNLMKERKRLAAFAKTGLLMPGETEELELTFDAKMLASFSEEKSAWLLEKGIYCVLIGNSSAEAKLAGALKLGNDTILERVKHICPLRESLGEIKPESGKSAAYEAKLLKQLEREKLPVLEFRPHEVENKRKSDDEYDLMAKELAAKLTNDELAKLVVGEISRSHNAVFGAAGMMVPGAAGETHGGLAEKYGIAGVAMADGPAGIRVIREYEADIENKSVYSQGFLAAVENGCFVEKETHEGAAHFYQYCTAFPIGTMLARSWNRELMQTVGHAVGLELEELGIAWWLAPGMNIHRNPLCGRNFEYFSEDPLISGICAAEITNGVQSVPGVGTTIKHYACNNQEDNRVGSDSILSERALREIYLRGFELAVKMSQPMAIMTSYNLVNGVHSANNRDLCMVAAREEWDFRGFIMTDWDTTRDGHGSIPWKCMKAGNDLIMPGTPKDSPDILDGLEKGLLTRRELEDCAARLLSVSFKTVAYENE